MRRVVIEFEATDEQMESLIANNLMGISLQQLGEQKGRVIRMENLEVASKQEMLHVPVIR